MSTNNFLVTVTDLNILNLKVQNCTFLFPLQEFCCGYPLTFKVEDITISNSYLFINRLLTDEDLKKLQTIFKKLPNNIKGIIFRDLGVLELIKELNLKVEAIYYLAHNGLNYISINEYLDYVDSVVLSTDLTEKEIGKIIPKLKKKVVLFTFGLIEIMYSRRTLLSNFNRHFALENNNISNVVDSTTNKGFKVVENAYGTVFFSDKYYYNPSFFKVPNIKYYWLNPLFLDVTTISKVLAKLKKEEYDLTDLNLEVDPIFLKEKSISKLKSDNNE